MSVLIIKNEILSCKRLVKLALDIKINEKVFPDL